MPKHKSQRLTRRTKMGKRFESEIRTTLRYYQDHHPGTLYWFRLMDYMDFYMINPHIRPRHQPADFFMVRHAVSYLFECKSTVNTSWPFRNLTKHQFDSLLAFAHAGGHSYLLIKHMFDRRRQFGRDTLYAVEIEDYKHLMRETLKSRKSVPWDELEKHSTVLDEIKPKVWRLSLLWERRTLSSPTRL